MINNITWEAEALCARQNLKFVSAETKEQNIYAKGISRDNYGEIWVIRFDENDKHILSERLIRFDLHDAPDIPLCIIDDVAGLHEYMRDRTQHGLAIDPVDYDRIWDGA